MIKIAKKFEEFKEYQSIKESLSNLFDIPGLEGVSAQLLGSKIEIQLSNGDLKYFSIDELKDITKDEDKTTPAFLTHCSKLYQSAVAARYNSFTGGKMIAISKAEQCELFDIEKGGFFDKLDIDLDLLGAEMIDIKAIITDLPRIYDRGVIDGVSPEGVAIFTEFLNSTLEFIAAKVYTYLEHLGQDDYVIHRVPKGNLDNVTGKIMEGEAVETGQHNKPIDKAVYKANADYAKNMRNITKIVHKAGNIAGVKIGEPYDFYTGRKINATSIYLAYPVVDSDVIVISILNPVELRKVTGTDNYVFNIELEDGFIDNEFKNLSNEKEIADALKEVV